MEDEYFEKEKKHFYTSWWFILLISIIFILIGVGIYFLKTSSPITQYSKQTITILQDFKNGKISTDEAYEKISNIENRVESEKNSDSNNDKWLYLSIELDKITWELLGDNNTMSSDSLTISEIDEYITELRKY